MCTRKTLKQSVESKTGRKREGSREGERERERERERKRKNQCFWFDCTCVYKCECE